jgi:hypothetical protein
MGKSPRRHVKILLVALAVAIFSLTSYTCTRQQSPANTDNGNRAAVEGSAPGNSRLAIPAWPQGFPQGFPAATVSGNLPLAVTLPKDIQSPEQARPYFDYFSWESFIAFNWPATTGARGVPNQPDNPEVFLKAASGTPVVWGTYKESFEIFGQKNQRPTAWESFDIPISPCQNEQPGQKALVLLSKGDTTLDQINQAFSYPLIDQQKNYVSYEIRYNQAQYNFMRGQDNDPSSWLYLVKNLAAKEPVQMPSSSPPNTLGAVMLKASWRIKTEKDDANRYLTATALILDPQTQKCTPQPIILVGLHIAHKVAPFSEWVWSTFEHVDNVPPDTMPPQPAPQGGYSFNNGTATPQTTGGYANRPPQPAPSVQPVNARVPVQVTRLNPIPDTPQGASTRDINAYFQQLLKGTVWQYYQLVITQWPAHPGTFVTMENGGVYPRDAGDAFPANGAVNTTMETYFQSQNDAAGAGGNSCMSCHYRAGKSDFSWGLNRRSHQ